MGSLMIRNVREINWDYLGDSVPAFIVLLLIPFGYNVGYGVIAGFVSYAILNGTPWMIGKISRGRFPLPNDDFSEDRFLSPSSPFLDED